ncbi:hypothetical protein BN000_00288 [Neobacillus massiliamazoniensis]|uniref:Uncharacterized protein n=1 Tax=Neobacillus massiliamazoniensis TaxID=1499688 RepID=A0A0U1NQZ8_9BACI|nr:hypothetical protein BN000_00288 [Neobacillus massiliamazoniensis]
MVTVLCGGMVTVSGAAGIGGGQLSTGVVMGLQQVGSDTE